MIVIDYLMAVGAIAAVIVLAVIFTTWMNGGRV